MKKLAQTDALLVWFRGLVVIDLVYLAINGTCYLHCTAVPQQQVRHRGDVSTSSFPSPITKVCHAW
jgi:hypothetical protein